MCGIAGLMALRPVLPSILHQMTDVIAHRGPDDESWWIDREANVGLGHRRLSIVDLSPHGRQPMASADGRWVIAYNGEIYNHRSLRAQLNQGRKLSWRGHSDTETLIECIAEWGLERTLSQSVGMFALALWDRQKRTLHLVRDRFGEKPLYYGWVGDDFLFASELKALQAHPAFTGDVDWRALRAFTGRSYIPAPLSVYEHIYKLEPGCVLTLSPEALGQRPSEPPTAGVRGRGFSIDRYWSYRDVVIAGLENPITDEDDAAERLHAALAESINGQSIADVPVGAFLSGGLDSSLLVALYQKYATQPVRTFSIGFEDARYNEANYAKAVAQHFRTEHNEHYVTAREAQAVLPLLPTIYDEPFADSSQIPTYLVSKFAREQVTVALSGDGGDELFGGYNRYLGTAFMWSQFSRLPPSMRKAVGRNIAKVSPARWDALVRMLPGGAQQPAHFGARVQHTFKTLSEAESLDDLFDDFLTAWSSEANPVLGPGDAGNGPGFDLDLGTAAPAQVRMMYCDAKTFLPDDVLCKVDRASMAVSLETRAPFLDHRVAEVAAHIPLAMKVRRNRGKMILRQLLHREAPAALFDRPKAGFVVPVGEWLRGELRPWAEALLDERRLKQQSFFDAAAIRLLWDSHLAGRVDAKSQLWPILMFQAWLDDQPTPMEQRQRSA